MLNTVIIISSACYVAPRHTTWKGERKKEEEEEEEEVERKFFPTDDNINSIHHQVESLANEPEVSVVDSQDFLLASGARVCKSCNCKKLL